MPAQGEWEQFPLELASLAPIPIPTLALCQNGCFAVSTLLAWWLGWETSGEPPWLHRCARGRRGATG